MFVHAGPALEHLAAVRARVGPLLGPRARLLGARRAGGLPTPPPALEPVAALVTYGGLGPRLYLVLLEVGKLINLPGS